MILRDLRVLTVQHAASPDRGGTRLLVQNCETARRALRQNIPRDFDPRVKYDSDKPSVFTLVDRSSDDRYFVPAKFTDESAVRLLLADHNQESLTVYTDGFRAYDLVTLQP